MIFFNPLSRPDIVDIAKLELSYLVANLAEQHREVSFDDRVVELVVKEGFSPTYGARNIKRTIQRYVEDPLSEMILRNVLPDMPALLTIEGEDKLAVSINTSGLDPAGFKPEEEEAKR